MGDGKVRNISQVSNDLAKTMNLSEEELSETYETSGQNRITDVAVGRAHGS